MRARLGLGAAASLLAGTVCCLLLPGLPPWPWLALAFACGLGLWLRGGGVAIAGPPLIGFGLAGLHAAVGLQRQLPVALEGGEFELVGRVVELPQVETRRTRFRFLVEGDAPAALRGRRLQLAWYDEWGASEPGLRVGLHAG